MDVQKPFSIRDQYNSIPAERGCLSPTTTPRDVANARAPLLKQYRFDELNIETLTWHTPSTPASRN